MSCAGANKWIVQDLILRQLLEILDIDQGKGLGCFQGKDSFASHPVNRRFHRSDRGVIKNAFPEK